ncbi:MAG: hypothetical protein JW731_17950 [Bacteroidales bacterium]|nr:hypothetical protein [Bacteroidales bacterium]
MIKRILYIIPGLIFMLLLNQCERKEPVDLGEFNCDECFQEKPEWGSLIVYVTLNDENPKVPLVVYIGNIEDGNIDWYDTADTREYYVPVRPDKYYSVRAEYRQGSKTIYAVDGDKFKLKYNNDGCDEPCYYFKGGYYDLQLKE